MPIQVNNVTHNNNGHSYRIAIDIAKEGSEVWDLTPYFKGRVGDDNFGLQIVWYYQGQLLDVTGKTPYIKGNVGHYSFDDQKNLQLAPDADVVVSHGNPNDCQANGQATYYFPQQMFPTDGVFKGFIGLQDDNQNLTGVDIWFRVLPGVANMGKACDFYVDILDKTIADFKEKIRQQSIDFETALQQELQKEQDLIQQKLDAAGGAIDEDTAALVKLAASVGTIQAQIDANNFESRSDHNRDYNELSEMIEQKLAKMSDNIEWLQNESSIQTKYPSGAEGLKIAVDTNHKWLWFNNVWTDCGAYQAAEDPAIARNRFINTADDLKIPYNDLNTLPINSVVTYASGLDVSNCPATITGNYTVRTIGSSADASNDVGAVQMLFSEDNSSYYYRSAWGYPGTKWGPWQLCVDSKVFSNKDELVSPYDNLDLLPAGSIVTYVNGILTNDFPFISLGFTVITNGKGFPQAEQTGIAAGKVQFVITNSPVNFYYRIAWGTTPKWTKWQSLNNSYVFTGKDGLIDQYKDLDMLPAGSTVTYADDVLDNGFPYATGGGYTVITKGKGFINNADRDIKAGQVQTVITVSGKQYYRIAWGVPGEGKWSDWQLVNAQPAQYSELPSLSIFQKFGVIGDSFSKGYLRKPDGTEYTESKYKWGQMIADKCGTSFTDFSVSGQTTKSFVNNTLEKVKSSEALDAYFIALGINDAATYNNIELGTIADITENSENNPRTFYGDYGRIIDAIRKIAPNARIIPITIMSDWGLRNSFDPAIKVIANHYGLPVIDIQQDNYFASSMFTKLMSGGHPTVPGYGILANHLTKLIQKCVVDNPDYFNFMGC